VNPHVPIFANIRDNKNLGDMLCGAKRCFPEFPDAPEVDFRQVPDGPEPLVLGGGGMIHPGIDRWIQNQAMKRTVFLVGVGVNYHDDRPVEKWQGFIRPCLNAGLRDRAIIESHDRFAYCPCPTTVGCDWEQWRAVSNRKEDLLVFQHYDHLIGAPFGPRFTRFTNLWHDGITLDQMGRYLSRFQRVVTNTYHGALWSALSGCRVVIWKPFARRFRTGLPTPLPIADSRDELDKAWGWWEYEDNRMQTIANLNQCYGDLADFRETVMNILQ
jgi:hypothetical protein